MLTDWLLPPELEVEVLVAPAEASLVLAEFADDVALATTLLSSSLHESFRS